jgi:hypothetical protein
MTMMALAKLETKASDIARMLKVFANERRVRIMYRFPFRHTILDQEVKFS